MGVIPVAGLGSGLWPAQGQAPRKTGTIVIDPSCTPYPYGSRTSRFAAFRDDTRGTGRNLGDTEAWARIEA